MTGPDADAAGDEADSDDERYVERTFTCVGCGFGTTHRVGRLREEVQATCLDCGDWTVQVADVGELVDAARAVAERLSGTLLTERQALAYLLRDVVGVDRQATADAMDTTPSNVDNLQRRGREKVADARRIVGELRTLRADGEPDREGDP